MTKRAAIGRRPAADPRIDGWLRGGGGTGSETPSHASVYTARLTIDVTPELRGRIKVVAFRRGVTVAEMLRQLLEEQFPDPPSEP